MKIVTIHEAKRRGLKRYYTGAPCTHGHTVERRVSSRACVRCAYNHRKEGGVKHADRYNAARRARYASDPEYKRKKNETFKQWVINNAELAMLSAVKRRAKASGTKFSLTLDDICIPKRCPILGIKLKRGVKTSCSNSPTLDRLKPNKGYIKGNVAVVSSLANQMKGNATAAQHRRIAEWMEDFQ